MSILSIITVNEYKTRYPDTALNNIRDARVQSALNLSFSYLDVKCGCAISSRWNIESPTKGYLTPEQKDYVKEAMYVETQYILANNLDFSQGADQTSFGSLSTSSSRPERKEICESALMYLQKAGLYDYLSFSTPTYAGSGRFSTTQCGEIDPTDVYITETTADLRYVHKAQGVDKAGKWLYVDSNGNVGLTDQTLDPLLYYTRTQVNEKLLPLQQMRDKLALGYLKSISRNTITQTITITDSNGNIITFPYGGSGGGTGGTIVDVTVNGVSVVDSEHIAVIDLTTYALKSELTALIDDATTVANKTWSSQNIQAKLDALAGIVNVEVVEEVPATPVNNTMYYIHISGTNYAIRLYANDTWTDMGTTQLDISNLVTINTAQVITGAKTFKNYIRVENTNGKNNDISTNDFGNILISTSEGNLICFPDDSGTVSLTKVSVSPTGTATDEVKYITINGVEKKIGGEEYTAGDNIEITNNVIKAKDVVTTDTEQDITAKKSFKNDAIVEVVSTDGTYNTQIIDGAFRILDNDTNWKTYYRESTITREGGGNFYTLTLPNATGTFALTSDIPSTTNFVTIDTQQSISSIKSFNNDVYLNGGLKKTISGTATYTYTLPSANGTLALTSNLSSYLQLAGGTLTGGLSGTTATFSGQVKSNGRNVLDTNDIINNLTSTSTTDALSANQGKVLNDKFASYLPLAGGTMTGAIAMGSKKITGLATPTNNADAATKSYVDGKVTYTYGTPTKVSTYIGTSNSTYVKFGRVVVVSINVNVTTTIPANTTFMTGLPQTANDTACVMCKGGSTTARIWMRGTTIQSDSEEISTGWYNANLVYISNS